MDELYSIGDAARRTGLSVSAIRLHSDAAIVAPRGSAACSPVALDALDESPDARTRVGSRG